MHQVLVRDRTAVAVDIWVNKVDVGGSEPALIWQIHERNPRDKAEDLTRISHAEIVQRLTAADRSVVDLGFWLLGASAVFLLLGVGVSRWNRSRANNTA